MKPPHYLRGSAKVQLLIEFMDCTIVGRPKGKPPTPNCNILNINLLHQLPNLTKILTWSKSDWRWCVQACKEPWWIKEKIIKIEGDSSQSIVMDVAKVVMNIREWKGTSFLIKGRKWKTLTLGRSHLAYSYKKWRQYNGNMCLFVMGSPMHQGG